MLRHLLDLVVTIRDDEHRRELLARRLDGHAVKLHERIARFDRPPLLCQGLEALSLELDGIEADMDQQLDALALDGRGVSPCRRTAL